VLGLAWGLLVSGFLAFILWLRHRSSWQQREHEFVQHLKRSEDQAVERLLRALAPLLQHSEPHASPDAAAQLLELATKVLGARQGVDLESPSLKATLTSKEGNAMPDAQQPPKLDHRSPAGNDSDEPQSNGRW
jgi:hypothetical protein